MDAVESIIKENPRNVLAIIVGLVLIIISNLFFEKPVGAKARQVNSTIKKSEPKVVDFVSCGEIEDLVKEGKDGKLVMCRCWKSAKFPYCDGAHTKHNEETGDNVGPLIVKK